MEWPFLGGFAGINAADSMSAILYFRKAFNGIDFTDLFPC